MAKTLPDWIRVIGYKHESGAGDLEATPKILPWSLHRWTFEILLGGRVFHYSYQATSGTKAESILAAIAGCKRYAQKLIAPHSITEAEAQSIADAW